MKRLALAAAGAAVIGLTACGGHSASPSASSAHHDETEERDHDDDHGDEDRKQGQGEEGRHTSGQTTKQAACSRVGASRLLGLLL